MIPIIPVNDLLVVVTKLFGIVFLHPLYHDTFCLIPDFVLLLISERIPVINGFFLPLLNLRAYKHSNLVLSLHLKVRILLDVHLKVVK